MAKHHKATGSTAAAMPAQEDKENPTSAEQAAATLQERVQSLQLPKAQVLGSAETKGARRTRRWVILILIVALLGGGAWGYREYRHGHLDSYLGKPPNVDTFFIPADPVEVSVLDLTGHVIVDFKVKIGSRIPGKVVEVNFDEGDQVHKGDVLVLLDDAQYAADLQQAQAVVRAAEARLQELRQGARPEEIAQAKALLLQGQARRDLAVRELDRANELKDTISPKEFDLAKAGFDEAAAVVSHLEATLRLIEAGARDEQIAIAEADVQKAKAGEAKAQSLYEGAKILAPIDGTILSRTVELGEVVLPEMLNSSLYEIADLSNLWVEIEIQERDLSSIQLHQPCVIVTEAYTDREYLGELDRLAPVFNRLRGVRQGRIRILNPDEWLAPDMNCRVTLREPATDAGQVSRVLIPAAAVIKQHVDDVVYVLQDGRAIRRPVTVGPSHGDLIEIQAGLETKETVILWGDVTPADGLEVSPIARTERSP